MFAGQNFRLRFASFWVDSLECCFARLNVLTKFHLKLAKGHVNLCCRCCCWSHFNTTFTQQIKFARLSLNGHSTTSPPPFPTLHTSAVAACESSATGIWLTGRAATSTLGHMSKSSIGRTLSVEMWECVWVWACCVCVQRKEKVF